MPTEKADFESSLKMLENIVSKLETGDCSLEESITLFEKGIKLSEECSKCLETARQKIFTLTEAEEGENLD